MNELRFIGRFPPKNPVNSREKIYLRSHRLWFALNWHHGEYVALSFKMTPTLCQSNTMLAIPYSEHESCIFVCYNTLRFVDNGIVLGPVHPLFKYHWSGICWEIAGKVMPDQWNDRLV